MMMMVKSTKKEENELRNERALVFRGKGQLRNPKVPQQRCRTKGKGQRQNEMIT